MSAKIEKTLDELATLKTILLSTLDETIFFTKLTEYISTSTKVDVVKSYLVLAGGQTQLVAINNEVLSEGVTLSKGEGLSGYVVRTKRAYYSNCVSRDPLLSSFNDDESIESELCVPVSIEGHVLGTVHLQMKSTERKFAQEDITKINAILSDLKVPLTNMKMYLMARNLNKELQKKIEEKEHELANSRLVKVDSAFKAEKVVIVGQSPEFSKTLEKVEKVAKCESNVVIYGESGTGKELLARKIHNESAREAGPYIVMNCSALNDLQIEEDLFGIVKGAHSNAHIDKEGFVERAHGGTLVIEEISSLTPAMQAKLLRFIESGEAKRIGSPSPYKANVRVVVVEKNDLAELVDEGRFLEDLRLRLATMRLDVSPIRERQDDVKVLVNYFLNFEKNAEDMKSLTSGAMEVLLEYKWPGNVRELRNIMERIYIMSDGNFIDVCDLPENLKVREEVEVETIEIFSEMTLDALEKKHICKTLEHLGGNKTKTAKALGITVKTLYNKLHSYGMVQPRA